MENKVNTMADLALELCCSICHEAFGSAQTTTFFRKCSHYFHIECAQNWARQSPLRCPNCARKVFKVEPNKRSSSLLEQVKLEDLEDEVNYPTVKDFLTGTHKVCLFGHLRHPRLIILDFNLRYIWKTNQSLGKQMEFGKPRNESTCKENWS